LSGINQEETMDFPNPSSEILAEIKLWLCYLAGIVTAIVVMVLTPWRKIKRP